MSLLTTIVAGVAFGLALAAPPGPMNAIIAEESVMRGWSAGFRAGLGAALADVLFFLLALVGAAAFLEALPTLRSLLVAVGGVLMLYFAIGAARSARASFRPTDGTIAKDAEESGDNGTGFRKALVLGLTNPYQIVFWLTVGTGLLRPGTLDPLAWLPAIGELTAGWFVVSTGTPVLIVAFFAGIAAWIVGFPAALVAAEHRIEALAPVVAVGSAIVLAGFGVYFLTDAATALASSVQ